MTKFVSKVYHSIAFKVLQIVTLIAICGFSIHRWKPIIMDSWPIMKSVRKLLLTEQLFSLLFEPLRKLI